MFKFFTISEANAALPDVVGKFRTVLSRKADVEEVQKRLQIGTAADNSLESHMRAKQELNSAVTKFYRSIEELEETGVSLKSIDEGLLDFPAKRFDEDVWLCWKYGETEIKFWHDMESGFMGRKPIEVSDESLV